MTGKKVESLHESMKMKTDKNCFFKMLMSSWVGKLEILFTFPLTFESDTYVTHCHLKSSFLRFFVECVYTFCWEIHLAKWWVQYQPCLGFFSSPPLEANFSFNLRLHIGKGRTNWFARLFDQLFFEEVDFRLSAQRWNGGFSICSW